MTVPLCSWDDDTLTPVTCNSQLAHGALPCDHYHPFYHYQSSAQYLWLAETLVALGEVEEARAAYGKAVFQDHYNTEAIEGTKETARGPHIPTYDKHPAHDTVFCMSVGKPPDAATPLHDRGVDAFIAGNLLESIACFNSALRTKAEHSNSHFALGKCFFIQRDYAQARTCFTEAIRISHLQHDAYHRAASADHLARGRRFLVSGELDLAVNAFTKALDLHRGNHDARLARARAYRAKGNNTLAAQDEMG